MHRAERRLGPNETGTPASRARPEQPARRQRAWKRIRSASMPRLCTSATSEAPQRSASLSEKHPELLSLQKFGFRCSFLGRPYHFGLGGSSIDLFIRGPLVHRVIDLDVVDRRLACDDPSNVEPAVARFRRDRLASVVDQHGVRARRYVGGVVPGVVGRGLGDRRESARVGVRPVLARSYDEREYPDAVVRYLAWRNRQLPALGRAAPQRSVRPTYWRSRLSGSTSCWAATAQSCRSRWRATPGDRRSRVYRANLPRMRASRHTVLLPGRPPPNH